MIRCLPSCPTSHTFNFQHCRFDLSVDRCYIPIYRSILTVPMLSTHSTAPSDQLTDWRDLKRAPTYKVFTEEEDPGYVSDSGTGQATPGASTPSRNGTILDQQSRTSRQSRDPREDDPGYVSDSRTGNANCGKSILSGIGPILSERGRTASTAGGQTGRC
jgi:hypothetical protein